MNWNSVVKNQSKFKFFLISSSKSIFSNSLLFYMKVINQSIVKMEPEMEYKKNSPKYYIVGFILIAEMIFA